MKRITLLLAAGVLAVTAIALFGYRPISSERGHRIQAAAPNNRLPRIRRAINRAHVLHESAAEVNCPIGEPLSPVSLEDAAKFTTILTGQVTASVTSIDPSEEVVFTWFKVRTSELLSRTKPRMESAAPAIPRELLPLAENEFVLRDIGGAAVKEGVTVTYCKALPLALNSQYVLFVNLGTDENNYGVVGKRVLVGTVDMFLPGILLIQRDGRLTKFAESGVWSDIVGKCGGTLKGLRACLKSNGNGQ
jgi:hypothetical protein